MAHRLAHRLLAVIFQGAFRRQFMALPRDCENGTFRKYLFMCYLSPQSPAMIRKFSVLRKKGGDKKKAPVSVKNNEISQLVDVEKLMIDFKRPIEKMKEEFIQHLSLRLSAGSLESLRVTHDGKDYELREITQISQKNPKNIVLNFTSFSQMIPKVLLAIENSGLNLNPQQDGTTLICPVPKITKEHKEHVLNNARILYYKCKENIKDVQNQYIKKVKEQEKIPEEFSRNVIKQIKLLSEKHTEEANLVFFTKQKELNLEK